jgi:hypothetical protein
VVIVRDVPVADFGAPDEHPAKKITAAAATAPPHRSRPRGVPRRLRTRPALLSRRHRRGRSQAMKELRPCPGRVEAVRDRVVGHLCHRCRLAQIENKVVRKPMKGPVCGYISAFVTMTR